MRAPATKIKDLLKCQQADIGSLEEIKRKFPDAIQIEIGDYECFRSKKLRLENFGSRQYLHEYKNNLGF